MTEFWAPKAAAATPTSVPSFPIQSNEPVAAAVAVPSQSAASPSPARLSNRDINGYLAIIVFARATARLSAPCRNRPGLMMSNVLRSLFATASVVALLMMLVIVEVVVAMFAYMYLALNHIETFGYLVGLSRDVLNLFAEQLKQYSPELALRADTTLLGELGPKSILLLLIGSR